MILGIDAGTTGALAILDIRGRLTAVADMPVAGKDVAPTLVADLLADWETEYGDITVAAVERLHAMPKPVGSVANFSKGLSYGVVLGALAALRCPVETPTPAAWKRDMGVTKDKDTARNMALKLWPAWSEMFKRKKDADRAEAALIAEHCRRLLIDRGQVA